MPSREDCVVAEEWLLAERKSLMQNLITATIQAMVLGVVAVLAVMGLLYFLAVGAELDEQLLLVVLVLLMLFGPALGYFLITWLRRRLWRRAIRNRIRRLRARQFLSRYAESVGQERLERLPARVRARVQEPLDRERAGRLPPESDYVAALEVILLLELVERGAEPDELT